MVDYYGFFFLMTVSFGLMLDIPWLVMVLVRVGLVTPKWLASQRRYVILIAVVLAAMLSPPDVISQLALFFPILVLFEVGLLASRFCVPKRVKEAAIDGEGPAEIPEEPKA